MKKLCYYSLLSSRHLLSYSGLIIFFAYLSIYLIVPHSSFWVVDNASKFLQVKSMQENDYQDVSLPYPGKTIDPQQNFQPFPPHFAVEREGKLYSVFPLSFVFLSSLGYHIAGFSGLYWPSLLGTLLSLLGLSRLISLIQIKESSKGSALIFLALATPFCFYSFVHWEITLAAGMVTWGLFFGLRGVEKQKSKDFFLCAFFFALSIYLRNELSILAGFFLFMLGFLQKENKVQTWVYLSVSFGLSLLPLLIGQWLLLGTPFGFHLSANQQFYDIISHLSLRGKVFFNLFLGSKAPFARVLLGGTLIGLLFIYQIKPKASFSIFFPLVILLASINTLLFLQGFTEEKPIHWLMNNNSFLASTPLLWLAFFRPCNSSILLSLARCTALAYLFFFWLFVPEVATRGIFWESRYFLILYPLLTWLALNNLLSLRKQKIKYLSFTRGLCLLTLVLSIYAQIYSIDLLFRKKHFSEQLNEIILAQPEKVVITDTWFLAQEIVPAYLDKWVFLARDQKSLESLIGLLRKNSQPGFIYLTKSGNKSLVSFQERSKILEDNGLNFYSVQMISIRLK